MKIKKLIFKDNKRFRLVEPTKRKAKQGEFFLDQQTGELKEAPFKTAEKFYVYHFIGEGRFYLQENPDSKRDVIRDAKNKSICASVNNTSLTDTIISALNRSNFDSDEFKPP